MREVGVWHTVLAAKVAVGCVLRTRTSKRHRKHGASRVESTKTRWPCLNHFTDTAAATDLSQFIESINSGGIKDYASCEAAIEAYNVVYEQDVSPSTPARPCYDPAVTLALTDRAS